MGAGGHSSLLGPLVSSSLRENWNADLAEIPGCTGVTGLESHQVS